MYDFVVIMQANKIMSASYLQNQKIYITVRRSFIPCVNAYFYF